LPNGSASWRAILARLAMGQATIDETDAEYETDETL
jgi:hypothetical protein